jgi:hypothetical protein
MHDLIQARFVNRQRIGVPGCDAFFVQITNRDPNIRALEGDHRHGRSADIASAETTNFHEEVRFKREGEVNISKAEAHRKCWEIYIQSDC